MDKRLEFYKNHNPFIELVGTYYNEGGIEFERLVHSSIQADFGNEWYTEDKLGAILDYIHNGVPESYIKVSREFIGRLKEYCEYAESGADTSNIDDDCIEELMHYYNTLGYDKCKALNFQKSKLDKYISESIATDEMFKNIYFKLSNGFISCADLKALMTVGYANIGIKKAAKATDILDCNFINAVAKSIRIDGVKTKGFELSNIKFSRVK